MASTISAARAGLHALLDAHTWPAPRPQVTFGSPDAYEESEVVAMLGVETPDEEPAVIGGNKPREEQFVIVVAVKAHDPAGTAATVDARGWALMDEVREVVYADQTLAGALTGASWARIASQTSVGAQPADGGGWVYFGQTRVACRARIA
jgi:hypothetical protein